MVSLDQVVEDAKRDFDGAADSAALEDAKARYLVNPEFSQSVLSR